MTLYTVFYEIKRNTIILISFFFDFMASNRRIVCPIEIKLGVALRRQNIVQSIAIAVGDNIASMWSAGPPSKSCMGTCLWTPHPPRRREGRHRDVDAAVLAVVAGDASDSREPVICISF